MTPLPWQDLDDAYARLEAATRSADVAELMAARANLERSREHLAALGGLLFLMMLEHGSDVVRNQLAAIVGDVTNPFCEQAAGAVRMANRTWNEVDALRVRIAELEEQIARLTPGIGESVEEEESAFAR